ncbi:cytosolic endo-beta-N-acetylglucosaminidase 1 [Diospyros lotus]|uniref:cytosolic endo-beta-N-acetylglucosaminidase 1 n=1 Tax=Diospyros lotus TaxID=55363 RepID=UPI002253442A|nr:cytosolic endo-beta-N-acetylglucosaminidase 1 [Diospyros lotus]
MDPNDKFSTDPVPVDPSEPAVPVSYPIKTLEELESRSYFNSFHFPFNKASVSLPPAGNGPLADRPRILVCHDLSGGYSDDRWVQGGANADAYAIWHWYLTDVFVYFSHNLVTLPPPCWTNTGHKHGVKVLGTFIAEWDEGRVIAAKLVSTKENAQMYAERLAELAIALGFDGWLLNMEVSFDVGLIPNLKEFVSHLTNTMHSLMPGSLVIWYDSVTVDGNLCWQNQLNESNKPFFDICDGIYVNYSWKEDYPKLSADVAGDRKHDVYMGIDVFGRGTYGGGGWDTNVALDVLKKDDVSASIFAPGWIYETKQPPDFQTAQNRWWGLVEKSWGISQNHPQVLPFYSNFDQGHGYHFAIEGGQVSSSPWNNISSQGSQPFLEISGDLSAKSIQVLVDFKEASYSGGGNITFKGILEDNAYFTTCLFKSELFWGDLPVHFTYSVKSDESSLIGLYLEFSSDMKEKKSVLLASLGKAALTMKEISSKFTEVIEPSRVTMPEAGPGWVVQESSIAMNGYTLTGIHAMCYRSKSENELRLKSSLAPSPTDYFAILGDITVKTSAQSSNFPPSTSWLVEGQYIKWSSGSQGSKTLSVKVVWSLKDGDASLFPKYNIFVERLANQEVREPMQTLSGEKEYLGVAFVKAFYVSDLAVPPETSNLKFIIQVCGADGACQKVDDSPSFLLPAEGYRAQLALLASGCKASLLEPQQAAFSAEKPGFAEIGRGRRDLQDFANIASTKDLVNSGKLVGIIRREVRSKYAVLGASASQKMLLKASPAFSILNSQRDNPNPFGCSARAKPRNGLVFCASKGANSRALTGVVFQPFEEVKKELMLVPSAPQVSLARQKYVDESEAALNEQINVEYNMSYVYHALYAYFDRDNVALKGLAKFFKESSQEEREHAEKLMEYQNKRGGRVKLQCMLMPSSEFDHAEKGDALYAMELALSLEKLTNEKLLNLHAVASQKNDVHLIDFIESEFLSEQVEAIRKISEYVAQLRRVGKGHGVWHFDQMLLHEEEEVVA